MSDSSNPTDRYHNDTKAWRGEMDESLRKKDGWLALAGLFWLSKGANRFGTDSDGEIVLPPGSAPGYVGNFSYDGDGVELSVSAPDVLSVDGETVSRKDLNPDTSGTPNTIVLGDLTMVLIQRNDKYGVRLWDNRSRERDAFQGRQWFPIKDEYKITANYHPYPSETYVTIPNILGYSEEIAGAGQVTFNWGGKECQLDSLSISKGRLLLIFKDMTSGESTYPMGRFLTADAPSEGEALLDFNRAYNPPCAFTKYATCPLPPPQNRLEVRIEAGEIYPMEGYFP